MTLTTRQLTELVRRRQQLIAEIDERKAEIDNDLNPAIGLDLALRDVTSDIVVVDGQRYSVSARDGQWEGFNEIKLIEAGVTQAQLEAGRTKGKQYTAVTVRNLDKKKDDNANG